MTENRMSMKLYYAPGTCALACWIALDWAGAEYEVEKVEPRSETYRAINPLGTVPAIDIGGTRPMTQADAILKHVIDTHPHSNLGADKGEAARFEFDETMAFLSGDFHPAFWPYFTPERFTSETSEEALQAVRAASHARVERVLSHLDALIGKTGHVYRGKRSVADGYAFVMTRWSSKFPMSWRDYPNLRDFMERMEADPSVARILQESYR
jgi:glutathione S-transferase